LKSASIILENSKNDEFSFSNKFTSSCSIHKEIAGSTPCTAPAQHGNMVISTNYVQNEDSGLKSAHESAGSTEPGNDLSAASLTFCGTPINMPNFTCQQPLDDQFSIAGFLESAIEDLNPIDCRDGSDIYQCSQLLEFENKLLESDLRPLPCDIEPGCEISLINLAALNIADKSYLSIVNQKEICMPQTSSNSNNKEDLD